MSDPEEKDKKRTVFHDIGVALFISFVLTLLSLAVRDLYDLAQSLHRIADQLTK